MKATSSIVVGVDFSECSRVALIHALRFTAGATSALHPVHVVETTTLEHGPDDDDPRSLQGQIQQALVEDATHQWEAFAATIRGARGLHIDVRVGSRLGGIREQIVRHSAELLVLGAFGASRPNVGLGTVASGCIRGVPIDVLVVRDNYREAFRTVAVGIDFSAASRRALESAAFVARHDGARLYAVHVASDDLATYARLRNELRPRLESFVATTTAAYPGLDVRCHVYPYPRHRSGILEFAALVDADLIAIGTKGHSNLHDVVLGSTAEKVLRDSSVAVWVARAPAAAA